MSDSSTHPFPPPPPPPPFLRLPPQLRRRVYYWAGLAPLTWNGLPKVFDLHGDFDTDKVGFHGLLLSCHTVYAEASALLYSLNRFVIRMPPDSPYAMYMPQHTRLAPLRALTASSLASLRHLKIVLSEASCHHLKDNAIRGYCCDYVNPRFYSPPDGCKHHDQIPHNGPLQATDPFTQGILDEWQSTVALLASRGVSLDKLELLIVCDVRHDEPGMAQLAVAPLASLAPLKDCHARLCREPNAQIQEIAHDTVLNARGISRRPHAMSKSPGMGHSDRGSSASRLLALPRELRFRILEYTDLITPWKEVTWDGRSAVYSASRCGCDNLEWRGRYCAPSIHHGCQFSTCWETYSNFPSVGCFCRLRHSASSTTCRCWGAPKALFLACRTIYHDSQVVFFSGNRFVVHDFDARAPWHHPPLSPHGGYPTRRFAISIFLRDVVPDTCLGLLRFLEVVFPFYPHDSWPRDGDPAMEDWIGCIGYIKHKVNAPALTVRLYMADTSDFGPQDYRGHLSKEDGHEVLKAYTRILGPLAELGSVGLARFYAHFEWPWAWTEEVRERIRVQEGGQRWLADKEAVLKERAERWVMTERYGTLYEDCEEPPESLWKLFHFRDC